MAFARESEKASMRKSKENDSLVISTHVEVMEFAREEDRYVPVEVIRSTRSAAMLKVLYVVQDSSTASSLSKLEIPLQILIVDTNKNDCIYELTKEYTLARRCVHKNLVAAHVSFKAAKTPGGGDKRDHLCVVMPLVSRVSLRSMMMSSSAFRHGLPEPVTAFVLRELLAGLDCIHTVGGNVHGNISAGCIYMDDEMTVKLAFSALTCEERTTSFRECEVAPEMTESSRMLFETAADIWSFGLLILELVYREIPVSTYDGLESFINNIIIPKSINFFNRVKVLVGGQNPAGSRGAKRISGQLGRIIRECLRQDPKKRPTAKELLEHDYFKVSRGTGSYDVGKVMKQLQKHAIS